LEIEMTVEEFQGRQGAANSVMESGTVIWLAASNDHVSRPPKDFKPREQVIVIRKPSRHDLGHDAFESTVLHVCFTNQA
tara:strand:- start:223 stop:459 length:237 start_codon:yes stop_codon:yes gene_type:complete